MKKNPGRKERRGGGMYATKRVSSFATAREESNRKRESEGITTVLKKKGNINQESKHKMRCRMCEDLQGKKRG